MVLPCLGRAKAVAFFESASVADMSLSNSSTSSCVAARRTCVYIYIYMYAAHLRVEVGRRVLLGELPVMGGTVWTHPSLRIAHVGQHHTEALQDYLHLTATQ